MLRNKYVFTTAIVNHIPEKKITPSMKQFKSDNCATPYTGKYVFW